MRLQRLPRTRKEKADYAAPLVDMARRANVAEYVMIALMQADGVETFHVCGCREGTFPVVCPHHDHEARVKAERLDKHRECPCKLKDKLCAETAAAIRQGNYEWADKLRRARESHQCPGARPEAGTPTEAFWLRAEAVERERVDRMLYGERPPCKFEGDPFDVYDEVDHG